MRTPEEAAPVGATGPVGPAEERLAGLLARRGLEAHWLDVGCGHEPEALAGATRGQRSLVAHAKGHPGTGENGCAAWVEGVFRWAGLGYEPGSACELYQRHCHLRDAGELRVAMIVAVPSHPFDASGLRLGHVGIYVGDGEVMDCVAAGPRTVPLRLWCAAYGVTSEPRWGWMRGIALG